MTMKMKGLLKGLRYISQIFDEEEEPELQIGNPTDVKHVAHIGWDGPTANAPSWINQFKGEGGEAADGAPPVGDMNGMKGQEKSSETTSKRKSEKAKGSRRKSLVAEGSAESPRKTSTSEGKTKQSLPSGADGTSGQKEKSSRRKKAKGSSSSSKTSKSKQSSQVGDGLASDSGKAPSGYGET